MQKGCKIEDEVLELLWSKNGSVRVKTIKELRTLLQSGGFTVGLFGELLKGMRNRRLIGFTKLRDGSKLTEVTLLKKGYDKLGCNKRPVLAAAA